LELFTHFYHHLISAESVKKPIKIEMFARLCRFFFNGRTQYPHKLLRKDTTPFKLFEDNDPRPRSFEEIVDSLYDTASIREQLKTSKLGDARKLSKMLHNVPGSVSARLQ